MWSSAGVLRVACCVLRVASHPIAPQPIPSRPQHHFLRHAPQGIAGEAAAKRLAALQPYQVTSDLMSHASPDAYFMNCLPAMRGEEQTAEVIDGPQSIVFDQAENRLHAQKALLKKLILREL